MFPSIPINFLSFLPYFRHNVILLRCSSFYCALFSFYYFLLHSLSVIFFLLLLPLVLFYFLLCIVNALFLFNLVSYILFFLFSSLYQIFFIVSIDFLLICLSKFPISRFFAFFYDSYLLLFSQQCVPPALIQRIFVIFQFLIVLLTVFSYSSSSSLFYITLTPFFYPTSQLDWKL